MGGHHNQDYFKVQGTSMRSRDIARLYRKQFAAREARLRRRGPTRTGAPIPTASQPPAQPSPDTRKETAPDIAVTDRERSTEAREAQERRREAPMTTSLPERFTYLLPSATRRRLRAIWRRTRRPLGITAGAVLAPLTVARLVRRIRKGA